MSQGDHERIVKAISLDSIKEYDAALAELDKVLSTHDNDTALAIHGKIYLEKNDTKHALQDIDKVIQHTHTYPYAYFVRGLIKAKSQNYEGAIRDFTRAIKIDAKYTKAYYDRGLAYALMEDYKHAMRDFDKAIELDPLYANAWFSRGFWKDISGDSKGAIDDFYKAIELDPKNKEIYLELSQAFFQIGNKTLACENLNKALSMGCVVEEKLKATYCK